MPNRRKTQRWSRRVAVRYWPRGKPDLVSKGYTTNISEGGAFIETQHVLRSNTRLQIEFASDRGGFVMEARVTRAIKVPVELHQVRKSGMGVQFATVKELMAEILPLGDAIERSASEALSRGDELQTGPIAQRPDLAKKQEAPAAASEPAKKPERKVDFEKPSSNTARFHPAAAPGLKPPTDPKPEPARNRSRTDDTQRLFTIRFKDVERLRDVWKSELQYGGLFLPTRNLLPVDAKIDLRIFLPESEEPIDTEARVVVVNQPGPEDDENLLVGLGVRLSHPEPLFKPIRQLLGVGSSVSVGG